jgi:hypothetical protein
MSLNKRVFLIRRVDEDEIGQPPEKSKKIRAIRRRYGCLRLIISKGRQNKCKIKLCLIPFLMDNNNCYKKKNVYRFQIGKNQRKLFPCNVL